MKNKIINIKNGKSLIKMSTVFIDLGSKFSLEFPIGGNGAFKRGRS